MDWETIWQWLSESDNQATLGFLGGGLAAFVGAIWAVFKFLKKGRKAEPSSLTVIANRGGVAAGRDAHVTRSETTAKEK